LQRAVEALAPLEKEMRPERTGLFIIGMLTDFMLIQRGRHLGGPNGRSTTSVRLFPTCIALLESPQSAVVYVQYTTLSPCPNHTSRTYD